MAEVTDRIVKGSKKIVGETGKFAEGALRDTGRFAKGALEGSSKFAQRALKGTASLASDTIKGSEDFAKGVFGTSKNLAMGAIGDTTKFAKNTFSRTGKVAKDILHGRVGDALSDTESLLTGTVSEVVDDIESGLDSGLSNKYVSTTLKVLIALYAAFAAPKLPKEMAMMLDNTIVRILIAVLIVFVATKDSSMAILLSLAFILSLQTANKYKLLDTSESVSKRGQLSWLPSANANRPHSESGVNEHYANYAASDEEQDQHDQTFAPALQAEDGHSNLMPHQVNHESPLAELSPDQESLPSHLDTQGHADPHLRHGIPADTHELEYVPSEIQMGHSQDSRVQTHSPAGDNCVPGANQKTCVQTFRNGFCPQGLNQPMGYDHGQEYSKV